MQHEREAGVPVVHKPYHVDTLGAPFKVILKNGVKFGVDKETGEETVSIPDTIGLINAVVRARVCHARKLNGEEIKFLRKAVGVRAKVLAEFLDMTPEHFSRCENGMKTMSVQSEKQFRISAYLASMLETPEDMFNRNIPKPKLPSNAAKKIEQSAVDFVKVFMSMKIEVFFDPDNELSFEFSRSPGRKKGSKPGEFDTEDGNWSGGCDLLAA